MLNERDLRTADLYGFTERVTKLQRDLLQIEGVTDVDFDLTGFLSSIPYVIFLPRYAGIPVSLPDYYERRRALLEAAIRVAAENGMTRTEDGIEDYGAHFYIVTRLKEEFYSKPVRYFSIHRPIGPGHSPGRSPSARSSIMISASLSRRLNRRHGAISTSAVSSLRKKPIGMSLCGSRSERKSPALPSPVRSPFPQVRQ